MGLSDDCSPTVTVRQPVDVLHEAAMTQYGSEVAGTLTARADSSPCSDRGQNVVCMASTHTNAEIGMNLSPTLTAHASKDAPVLFVSNGDEVVGALCARDHKGVGSQYVEEGKVICQRVTKGPSC
jgi:DNA (cytosine-5)-methyltransferase 1